MQKRRIVSKRIITEPTNVYDISIDNDDQYYILESGLISHNTFDKYSPVEISGGSGVKYFADVSIITFKGKQKEGTEQIGIVLRLRTHKSRFMQENKEVKIVIAFKKGFNKYSSLYELAQEFKTFKKEGFSWILADGQKVTMKKIREQPSKYFVGENLEAIRQDIMENFGFGENVFDISDDEELEDIVIDEEEEEDDNEDSEEII